MYHYTAPSPRVLGPIHFLRNAMTIPSRIHAGGPPGYLPGSLDMMKPDTLSLRARSAPDWKKERFCVLIFRQILSRSCPVNELLNEFPSIRKR